MANSDVDRAEYERTEIWGESLFRISFSYLLFYCIFLGFCENSVQESRGGEERNNDLSRALLEKIECSNVELRKNKVSFLLWRTSMGMSTNENA